MVGPKLYHIKHTREFVDFKDSAHILTALSNWLANAGFRFRIKNCDFSRGKKKGVHVNHIPKFKLHVVATSKKTYIVTFDYYSKVKLGTAIAVGILTSGISTIVGVATLTAQLADADDFCHHFWKYADTLAQTPGSVILVERWANDGKGNLVLQPVVTTTVAPVVAPVIPPYGAQIAAPVTYSPAPYGTHMGAPVPYSPAPVIPPYGGQMAGSVTYTPAHTAPPYGAQMSAPTSYSPAPVIPPYGGQMAAPVTYSPAPYYSTPQGHYQPAYSQPPYNNQPCYPQATYPPASPYPAPYYKY